MGLIDYLVIIIGMALTAGAVAIAIQRKSHQDGRLETVAGRSLGPYVLALGAGATANSGFVLTGAVGLGYTGGMVWCLMPLGWLIGDVIFWKFMAQRIHQVSVSNNSVSLIEMIIKATAPGNGQRILSVLLGLIISVLTALYITAQWLAAGKIGGWIFGISDVQTGFLLAAIVIGYTAISGVRGAAYTDFIQGCMMVLLVICLGALVAHVFLVQNVDVHANIPDHFLSLTGDWSFSQVLLTLVGFALLAISFNLGQPQMLNRWMSANSEAAIRKARWVYIAFIQMTWLSYTAFGAFIRLIMDVQDPEQALLGFIQAYAFPGLMGMFVAGAVATIASTSSALLAVSGNILGVEVLPSKIKNIRVSYRFIGIILIGIMSIVGILISNGQVYSTGITAVSLLGASLAAPILYIILKRKMTIQSVIMALMAGLISSTAWKTLGYDAFLNESGIGFGIALLVLYGSEKMNPNRNAATK